MTTLFVATTGGHLTQLVDIAARLPDDRDRIWLTHDNDQSRSMLAGEEVLFTPYVGVKDVRGVAQQMPRAHRLLHERKIKRVVSTGSGIALAYLPYLAVRGVDAHYVESVTRVGEPSLTGRILERSPRVRCHTQHEHAAGPHWHYAGSVLDRFVVSRTKPPVIRRAVVTLGTAQEFPFRPLLDALAPLLCPGGLLEREQGAPVDVLWQTGCTPVDDLDIEARPFLAAPDLERELARADLVVSHAGAGSALSALNAGRLPVLVPRTSASGEIGDDHQGEFAEALERRSLALARNVERISVVDLLLASAHLVTSGSAPPPIRLEP
jgi:UDP-N-acetylglucosamine transferase subunit ALG13